MRWPLSEQVGTAPTDLCEKWTGALDSSSHVPICLYPFTQNDEQGGDPASRIVILNCLDFLYTYVIMRL